MDGLGLNSDRGVTLLETMIVLAIVGVVLTSVAPNVSTILAKHRMIAELNNLSSAIQYTRFNAIDTQVSTLLCPSADFQKCNYSNWNLPKIIFADDNHNNLRDKDEPLIHATEHVYKGISLIGPKKNIRFYGDGVLGSPATILLCPQLPNPVLNRALIVSLQGRVRLSKDYNNDEIHETRAGKPVDCD